MENLPDDRQYLKAKIKELAEHTGLPDEEMPAALEEEPSKNEKEPSEPENEEVV